MNRVDFSEEQKHRMLVGVHKFLRDHGQSDEWDEGIVELLAEYMWRHNSIEIPENYDKDTWALSNDFEGKYRLLKMAVLTHCGEGQPLELGTLLTYYVNFFSSILLRLTAMNAEYVAAIKHVINPNFVDDEDVREYIYEDFDGIGSGYVKKNSIYVHPLWTTSAFYDQMIFEDRMELA